MNIEGMSVLDQKALDNIRALQRPGTPDLLARIVDIFLNDTPDGIATIHRAMTAGDLDTVRTKAHSIKSSAAYLGATAFSSQMSQLERAARENDLQACAAICKDIDPAYNDVQNSLGGLQDKAA